MVHIQGNNPLGIDLSIMPTLYCNLRCPHCMYDAGTHQEEQIDFDELSNFLGTVDWDIINSIGLYGGEPSVRLELYERVVVMLPTTTPRFIITNGTWSADRSLVRKFLTFVDRYHLLVFISTTPFHVSRQDIQLIGQLVELYPYAFKLKYDDTKGRLLPMGRHASEDWKCTQPCWVSRYPRRLAIMPSGDVIYQDCDGQYPCIGRMEEGFDPLRDLAPVMMRVMKECSRYALEK